MITITEARNYCIEENCGFCLTHTPPITCCKKMIEILIKENGLEWCKANIKEWTLNNYLNKPTDELVKV